MGSSYQTCYCDRERSTGRRLVSHSIPAPVPECLEGDVDLVDCNVRLRQCLSSANLCVPVKVLTFIARPKKRAPVWSAALRAAHMRSTAPAGPGVPSLLPRALAAAIAALGRSEMTSHDPPTHARFGAIAGPQEARLLLFDRYNRRII
jgi:hypothetical protein